MNCILYLQYVLYNGINGELIVVTVDGSAAPGGIRVNC